MPQHRASGLFERGFRRRGKVVASPMPGALISYDALRRANLSVSHSHFANCDEACGASFDHPSGGLKPQFVGIYTDLNFGTEMLEIIRLSGES